ncbi:MAG: hypothetical protein JO066_05940, partial [Verrucomicrobia bacterium]|nr:hypothetical protein [Verrucomicrobiota bacterium]
MIDFRSVFKIDFGHKNAIPLAMRRVTVKVRVRIAQALRRSAGKALSVDIYERGDHRYHVVWKGKTGQRCFASRGSLAEAKSFQAQKIAELERHREGRFNLDDREML